MVFRCLLKSNKDATVAIKTISRIDNDENSGIVGVGVGFGEGEVVVEVSGTVIDCVLLQSLVCPSK